ncbi:prenyltransferase/squalene oxidase repeat-containing protein [Candidatus Contendibacter odensensis]|uniref:Prenyltransferase alpha-alpha toroid domain-containing protein n=1 Tax=Candidatus Contendobacter odensis Run_B_J11 TaxID=1400861 RepID=A0A7U7G7L2_9GAMM|nr:prenyltransferase/squalene oxidase repeat-containing protein [Candidatus Contendobacter odensis]CDH43063.1 conserved hypothetical protein [Candidatus Contendobacter odensis Run_B_J11]
MKKFDYQKALKFIESMYDSESGGFRSVPGKRPTLYGTAYLSLARYYLTGEGISSETRSFMVNCQDSETGMFIGPELRDWTPQENAKHDREHLLLHLNCAAIPAALQFDVPIRYPLKFAYRFRELDYLKSWLDQRDLRDAWLEGNNLLFVGQLLVYLRDLENDPTAQNALDYWFNWLDSRIDPKTGLWGTDGFCSPFVAMAGGYHQLLVYYYENHDYPYEKALIDTTLALQHVDGGFCPSGGGGACEDVDAADILVNMYKKIDYRRAEIRVALRRLLPTILKSQNQDGGFSYKKGIVQSHMGIPDTVAEIDQSTAFATWFRIHTLGLMAEILTDDKSLSELNWKFSSHLSMGWRRSWDKKNKISLVEKIQEISPLMYHRIRKILFPAKRIWWKIYLKFTA